VNKITVLLIQPNPTHGWIQPMSIYAVNTAVGCVGAGRGGSDILVPCKTPAPTQARVMTSASACWRGGIQLTTCTRARSRFKMNTAAHRSSVMTIGERVSQPAELHRVPHPLDTQHAFQCTRHKHLHNESKNKTLKG